MSLPELIEIVPLAGPVAADISVPGSKSLTNRALILAALAEGETTLRGALWSEDTQVMVDSLRRLGFQVAVEEDPRDSSNRTLRVRGQGGRIPNAGNASQPLELFVGNAGTAARFLAALVCLGNGVLSPARNAAHVGAPPGRLVQRSPPVRLPRRIRKRPAARHCFWNRSAPGGRLRRQYRRKLPICFRAHALRAQRRLEGGPGRAESRRSALRSLDATG
jgi:hypothetical protein